MWHETYSTRLSKIAQRLARMPEARLWGVLEDGKVR